MDRLDILSSWRGVATYTITIDSSSKIGDMINEAFDLRTSAQQDVDDKYAKLWSISISKFHALQAIYLTHHGGASIWACACLEDR